MKKSRNDQSENLSSVTGSGHLAYDRETATRFDKTSVVLSGRQHNFSAEYELGFRDRNDGKPINANPYSKKLARNRWQRGWIARDRYTDAAYKWVEPVTDSKIVLWIVAFLFFGGSILIGILHGANR